MKSSASQSKPFQSRSKGEIPGWWGGTGGREGYGRREKKGREAGSLRWREAGEKLKKSSSFFLLLLTSSQRNEPNNVS